MRIVIAVTIVATLAGLTPAEAHPSRPTTYVVSRVPGDTPEGISVSRDGTMYVTSAGTGAVYRGTVRDPELHPFVAAGADGRNSAAGVHVDRWGRIFVAGFDTGVLYAYDRTGRLLAERPTRPGASLNDFTFSRHAVYVTDSTNQVVWRASLSATRIGALTPWLTPDRLDPAPGFLNGIVITPDQRTLLVTDQEANLTYRVDIAHRTARVIVVRGADGLFSADGMLLDGHRLYGVYNFLDADAPAGADWVTRLVRMNGDYTVATWVADSEIARDTDTSPTTIARDRGRLLWVNSQLAFAPGTPPYTVTQVPGLR